MFDIPMAPSALHRLAQERAEALQHAALLLGGRPWLRRAQRLLDDLRGLDRLTTRMQREAHALFRLLALDHDPQEDEDACFAALDPSDPYVEEICLLADALRESLNATEFAARGICHV